MPVSERGRDLPLPLLSGLLTSAVALDPSRRSSGSSHAPGSRLPEVLMPAVEGVGCPTQGVKGGRSRQIQTLQRGSWAKQQLPPRGSTCKPERGQHA